MDETREGQRPRRGDARSVLHAVLDPRHRSRPRHDRRDRRTDAERIPRLLTDTTVVKAFNTIAANDIVDDSRPEAALEERRAIFIAADDPDAKARVEEFVTSVGFAPFDTGDLATGSPAQQPGTELYGARLDTDQANRLLHE